MFDMIIKGGLLLDGTGKPGIRADVALQDGKIARIAPDLEGAAQIIDATGLVVTPGFIDSHSHADTGILSYPEQTAKLEQGITTTISGQCGNSAAPAIGDCAPVRRKVDTFLDAVEALPLGANFMFFVGHSTLRKAVMGLDDREPTPQELAQMEALLADAFEKGAGGLSFGLYYAPGCFAKTDEAIALAKVAAAYGRPIAAHIRNESDQVIEAVEEFITIVRASGVRAVLSHHKTAQQPNWGKVTTTLAMLQAAVDEGLDIYCDAYPYCASSTGFSHVFVPKSWRAGGTDCLLERIADPALRQAWKEELLADKGSDFSWVLVTKCPPYPQYQGLRLDKIAELHGKDQFDTAMDLIRDSRDTCKSCFFTVREEDLEKVLSWDRAMIGTDGGLPRQDLQAFHPRAIGSFPRVLGRYVRERGLVSLPEMIRRITALPASVYGLTGKGLLAEGYDADICIFDPEKIIDHADFINCWEKAKGLHYVIVGGQVVAEDATCNGVCPGKLLRR